MTLLKDISSTAKRCHDTLLSDIIGAAALCILMIAALHLPQVI